MPDSAKYSEELLSLSAGQSHDEGLREHDSTSVTVFLMSSS